MDSLASSFLKYGDEVLLYSEQMTGFLYSDGWFDSTLYLPKVEKEKLLAEAHCLTNFVFRISPKLSYDANKQLEKMSGPPTQVEGDQEENDQYKQEMEEYIKNKAIIEKRCRQEEAYNSRVKKNKFGEFVLYGGEIELIHKASGRVVTIMSKSTVETNKAGSVVLELKEKGKPDKCNFKILPRYKYRSEGDKIIYGDFFVLFNEPTKNFFYISPSVIVNKTDIKDDPPDYRPQVKFRRPPSTSLFSKFLIEMRQKNNSRFQLIPFKHAHPDTFKFIKGGDIVKIRHTEIGGDLCIDGSLESKQNGPLCFVRRYRGNDFLEEKNSNCLFEVEANCHDERGRFIKWRDGDNLKDNENIDLLGLDSKNMVADVEENMNYNFRLRHVNSGRYLSIKPGNSKEKYLLCLGSSSDKDLLNNTLFTLESQSVDPDDRLKSSIVVKIKNIATNSYISTSASLDKSSLRKTETFMNDIDLSTNEKDEKFKGPFKINMKSILDSDVLKIPLIASTVSKDEDAFIIEHANSDYIRDCLRIHSAIPLLKDYIVEIKKKREDVYKNKENIKFIENILTELIFFIIETDEKDPLICEGEPNKDRQKLIRELKFVEVLCDILYFPFVDKFITLENLGEFPLFAKICGLINRLLKHIVQDYRINEEYVAQWIELFFSQLMNTGEGSDDYSESTITAILGNNKKILDSQISKEDIINIVELCKSRKKNQRFINLINCLLVCQGEAVVSNQNYIVECVMEDENTKQFFVIPIRENNGSYEVFFSDADTENGDQWIDLRNIKSWSEKNDDLRLYDYYLSYLDLVTLSCFDRSYKGINAFDPIFPFDITFGCAKDESLPYEIRSRFTDILLSLHVDKQPLEPLRVPSLTRVWDKFDNTEDDIPFKENIPEYLLDIKPFVKKFLVEGKGMQKSYEKAKNKMMLSVLNLAKCLVIFGFYRNQEEFIEMIDPLITILDGSHDVATLEEEDIMKRYGAEDAFNENMNIEDIPPILNFTKDTSRIDPIIIKCKDKMSEVLGIVMDIQNDIRITKFLRDFNVKISQGIQASSKALISKKSMRGLSSRKTNKVGDGADRTLKLFEQEMDDKKLDLEVLSWSDYVCINLYLMLYKDEDLIRKACDLLVRFHSQRQSFFTLIKSVQMLEDEEAIETLAIVDKKLGELREMAQNSEFWLGQSDRESIKTSKKTIDILNYCSQLMIEKDPQADFEDSGDIDMNQDTPFLEVKPSIRVSKDKKKDKSQGRLFQEDSADIDQELQNFMNEKIDFEKVVPLDTETPNQEYQRMLRNLEAHEIIMLIIKQNSIKSTESEDLYKRVIKTAYSTLIRFVRNNKMNKKIMVKYVDTVFAEHHGTGLGSTQLEGEILKDDQSLLQKGYSDFKEKIEVINKHPLSSYLKASSMYYLTIYLKFKEEPIPENQIAVATELIDKENQNIIFLYEKDETRKELNTIVKSFVDSIQKQMSSNSLEIMVEIPPSLSYATQLLTVMAVATQGKNSITEIMCQSLFSVPALIKCFKEAKFAYTYKIALMQFFLDAYLDIEKDVPQELQDGIPEILDMLNDELMLCIKRTSDIGIYNYYIGKDVVENEIFKKGPSIYIISLLGRYRLSKLHEVFIYHNILTCLERIFQLRLIIDKRNEDSFLNIITSIQKLLEITKDKEDKNDVVYLIDVLKKNPQLRLILAKINNEDEKEIEENDAKDLINSSMNRSNISSIHRHGDSKQRIESRMIEASGSNAMNRTFLKNKDSVGLKLANMLNEIGEIQSFNDSMVNEFSEVIWHIKKIQYKSFLGFRGVCTLEPTDVIEALIDLTDLDGIQVTLEQIPIVIKILRRIIEIENKLTIKPAAEWSGDEDNPTPEIIRAQDLLTSCNACYLAANLVRNQKGDAVTNEAILMCIALLIGGNYNSQMKFWEDFVEDTDNRFLTLLSEILKSNFNKVMDHAIAYNEVCKRIQTLERSKDMEIKANEEENESEEMNELISIRDKLDARTQPDEDEDEDFTSIVYAKTLCIRILRFFQLLCENHNINLQDHLREQNDKDGVALGRNFDFPTYFSTMLGVFTKNCNIDIMDLGGQIIDTCIELIQGPCRGNQKALISAKIIDNSRDFIAEYQEVGMEFEMKSRGFDLENDEHLDMINETKHKLVILLLSLLEGAPDVGIINRMGISLDFLLLKDRMYQVYRKFIIDIKELSNPSDTDIVNYEIRSINSDLKLDSFESNVLEGFDIYILFQSLSANSKIARKHLEDSEFTNTQKAAYDFFKFHTGRIEVNVNDELERTYFPIRPVCKYMSAKRKADFILSANRESPSEKVRSLMESARTLIIDMKHEAMIDNSKFMIGPRTVMHIRNLSTLLAVVINILQLVYVKLDESKYYIEIKIDSTPDKVITIINYVLIAFSSLTLILYILSEGTLILNQRWSDLSTYLRKVYEMDEKASYDELDKIHEENESGPISQSWMLLTNPKYFEEDGKKIFGNWYIQIVYYLICASFIATDGFFMYLIFYITISVIGVAFDQIYLSFLLLDFVIRFKTLRNVIQSVTRNKYALILTGVLILIIIYIYASIAFFFLRSLMYNNNLNANDDTTVGESWCDTMISCYFNMISNGLRPGGGIGDVALPENFHNSKSYHTKLIFTASFHIIIIIIMLNIVFGIIIDTFAELRDEKKAIFEDQEDKCFICNMERYVFFEGDGEGFDAHVANDHNMWNYIYYLIHLETKDPTEFTGVESYVKDKSDKEDISWFPLHKAMVVDNPEDNEEKEQKKMIQEKLVNLTKELKLVNKKFKPAKKETK